MVSAMNGSSGILEYPLADLAAPPVIGEPPREILSPCLVLNFTAKGSGSG